MPARTFWDAYKPEFRRFFDAFTKRWEALGPADQRAAMDALPRALLYMSRKKRAAEFRIDLFVADRVWERFTADQKAAKRSAAAAEPKPEKTPEELERDRRLEDIARRRSLRFEEIKRDLKTRGLRGLELLEKATDRLQVEWPEGEEEPQPARPFLVSLADGVTVQ